MDSPEQEKLEHLGKDLLNDAEKAKEKTKESLKKGQKIIHEMCSDVKKEAENVSNKLCGAVHSAVERGCDAAMRDSVLKSGCNCGCDADFCLCAQIFPWVSFVGITLASGWISSLFMQPAGWEWFATLTRPAWAPPQWIFLPVWILLYFLAGTSVWLAWRHLGCRRTAGILTLFILLLILQISWTYMFFYNQNPFGAFIDMIWIFAVLILLMIATLPVCRLSAALLVPQLLWILYALILNYNIWRLN